MEEKRDVKPFIASDVKDTIYKLSFVTNYSVKKITEDLCKNAIRKGIGKELSVYFKREVKLGGVVYEKNKKPEKFVVKSENTERISMLVNSRIYEYANTIAFGIGCSISKVIGYFVESSMNDYEFLDHYIKDYLSKKVDNNRADFLQQILTRVNKHNEENHNITSLLLYIVDEYKKPDESVEVSLRDFVSK